MSNNNFLDNNFFLQTDKAKELFFEYAQNMPIIDFHCHLEAEDIYKDKPFRSLYEMWLKHDHYKWRLMRCSGYNEDFITGEQADYQKFLAYAKSLEGCIHNPLYIWSHLELKKYLGITKPISKDTAKEIWLNSQKKLKETNLSPRKCLKLSNVDVIFTTDDVMSDLDYHKLLKDENYKIKVFPTFRGDRAIHINKPFIKEIEKRYDKKINNLDDYLQLVNKRIDYFSQNNSKASDFALEYMPKEIIKKVGAEEIFNNFIQNKSDNNQDKIRLSGYLLLKIIERLHKRNMALQLHIGASRDKNTLLFEKLNKDCGCDGISDRNFLDGLADLFNQLKKQNSLPNSIIYNLNPSYNEALAALCGCFSDSQSNIQLGSAWWFLDNKDGIENQLKTFATNLNISRFVGMLTDSRSFTSYPRHDFFRRILCNFIGDKIEKGECFDKKETLEKIIKGICYFNAKNFFNL